MSLERITADIKHYADEAKAVHASGGFQEPQSIVDALGKVAEAIEALEKRQHKIERNIAHRIGTLMAQGFESDFIKESILNSEPNYPFGKEDPEQLEFDKAIDDALRGALRGKA